jgi:hypothetical protein
LRAGIERERLWAPVFVIPRRKTSLVEALYGRAAMAGVGAPWSTMGNSPERGERGREEERGGGVPWGGAAMEELGGCSSIYAAHARLVHSVRERRQEGGRRKEKKKKKKKKKKKRNKRKEKIWKFFQT